MGPPLDTPKGEWKAAAVLLRSQFGSLGEHCKFPHGPGQNWAENSFLLEFKEHTWWQQIVATQLLMSLYYAYSTIDLISNPTAGICTGFGGLFMMPQYSSHSGAPWSSGVRAHWIRRPWSRLFGLICHTYNRCELRWVEWSEATNGVWGEKKSETHAHKMKLQLGLYTAGLENGFKNLGFFKKNL